ncbi:MAG: ROK family protein [Bacteroidales bacterium]
MQVAVGIDIGGTNTEFALIDRKGTVLDKGKLNTRDYRKPEDFVEALFREIGMIAHKQGNTVSITGYGIGAPMGNINRGTIEHPAGLPWTGIIPVGELFSKYTTLPVYVTNDANAAAVGEMIYGGARGMKNFVVITLGTGLGGGLIVNGKLVYGANGFAGELGHTSVRPGSSNRECGCGRKGCLETYVSATGIKRTLLKIMADSVLDSELRNLSFNELDSVKIYDAANRGDKIATEAFNHTGRMLGFKLADLVATVNPEAIFLFGGLSLAGEMIFRPARETMEEQLLSVYKGKVKLLPSQLNAQNAAVMGAGSLIWAIEEI